MSQQVAKAIGAAIAFLLVAVAPAFSQVAASARADRRTPVVRAVERVAPAVVNISTETLVRNPYYSRGSVFELFSGERSPEPRERYVENSLGSGVIVDPGGYVVTNEHVLASASRITVTLLDGRQVAAELIGSASEFDLALLKLAEPGPYPHITMDFAETLHAGETVIAIGNPFGLQSSVTTGVLSAVARRVESGGNPFTDFLQTDAAINPGNSGGALLTINGDLIGINTQIDARGQNLGFAIPVARARKVFDELVRYGEVRNVWLGFDADATDTASPSRPAARELLVTVVVSGSPAARAGLRPGDSLLSLDGARVRDSAELHTALARVEVGHDVRLELVRSGAPLSMTLRAETFPLERGDALAWAELGLRVQEAEIRGVRVLAISEVREGSRAERIGLHRSLVVLGVDARPVTTREDFYRALIARLTRRSVMLAISDGRATYRVPMALGDASARRP